MLRRTRDFRRHQEANLSLTIDGWQIQSPRPLTLQEAALAILDWMKKGVLTAPRQ